LFVFSSSEIRFNTGVSLIGLQRRPRNLSDVFLMSELAIDVAPEELILLIPRSRCVSDVFLMSEFDIDVAPLSLTELL